MIAGIDYDTHAVHVVLLDDDDRAQYFRFDLCQTGDAFDRSRNVREAMPARTAAFWDDVEAIGIEDPRGYNPGPLYRVQGAILVCLPTQVLVAPLVPSQWRTGIGLPGNASKFAVAEWSIARYLHERPSVTPPMREWPQDAHDAHAIAHATRRLIRVDQAA